MENYRNPAVSPKASPAGVRGRRRKADQWACVIARLIEDLRALGFITSLTLAEELNHRGIPTINDRTWRRTSVDNLLHRYAELRRTNPKLVARTLLRPPPDMVARIAVGQIQAAHRQRALRESS